MNPKTLDRKGRWRKKTVSFRVSPEEDAMIESKVALSGISKQEYIVNSILDKDIVVIGNPYVFRNLHDEIEKLVETCKTMVTEDDKEMAFWLVQIVNAMAQDKKTKIKTMKETSRQ